MFSTSVGVIPNSIVLVVIGLRILYMVVMILISLSMIVWFLVSSANSPCDFSHNRSIAWHELKHVDQEQPT